MNKKNQKRKPLDYNDRKAIESLLIEQKSYRQIAKILDKNHTVISREVNRNSGNYLPYSAHKAQLLTEKRLLGKKKAKLEENITLKKEVINKIRQDWSPEQISGYLAKEVKKPPGKISHESIYKHIYSDEGRQAKLYKHLRTHRIKRQKWGNRKLGKIKIPERVSIYQRPEYVDKKVRFGDWETDTVESSRKGKHHLSVQYERKSQLCRIHKVLNKTADETKKAVCKTIDSLPLYLFLTITYDNGTENVGHIYIRDAFSIETYFCDPYCSWQKGGVENCNKLIRQYFPKGTDFSKVTDEEIYEIQEKLNNRPRKNLGYKTPNQVISEYIEGGAINT